MRAAVPTDRLPQRTLSLLETLAGPFQHDETALLRALTQLRALVIGSLLQELAVRLALGPAVGVEEAGRGLAEIAAELGTQLINQTSAGA
jgi:hypothetical protein